MRVFRPSPPQTKLREQFRLSPALLPLPPPASSLPLLVRHSVVATRVQTFFVTDVHVLLHAADCTHAAPMAVLTAGSAVAFKASRRIAVAERVSMPPAPHALMNGIHRSAWRRS
ncbi:unnamed protein product [Ectocarpus sp. 8 AP-2014]